MDRSKTKAVVSTFLSASFLFSLPSFAADNRSGDPNAAIRKMTVGNTALAEFEKVKKINNELAIDHYTGLLKKNPKDALTYAKRGKAYAALRDYKSAAKDYDRAIALDPKTADAYVGRAVARYMEKDYKGSWEDVHKAESLGGEFWPAFMDGLKASSGRDK